MKSEKWKVKKSKIFLNNPLFHMLEFLILNFVSHSIRDMMIVKKSLKLSLQHGRPDLFGKNKLTHTVHNETFWRGHSGTKTFLCRRTIFTYFSFILFELLTTPYKILWYYGRTIRTTVLRRKKFLTHKCVLSACTYKCEHKFTHTRLWHGWNSLGE